MLKRFIEIVILRLKCHEIHLLKTHIHIFVLLPLYREILNLILENA